MPITSEYRDMVVHLAMVFIKLGLEPRNSVGIIAFNCPEWFYSELAAIFAGGIAAGVYTTNSPDAVRHILLKSNGNIVVIDDEKQLAKIKEIRHKLPLLKAIIQLNGPFDEELKPEDGYYTWGDIEGMDVTTYEAEYEERLSKITADQAAALIFTVSDVKHKRNILSNCGIFLHLFRCSRELLECRRAFC